MLKYLILSIIVFGCLLVFVQTEGQTQAPVLLFDEDFTNGVFDGYGAGTNGQNWRINSQNQGVGFRIPNNRPSIPMALSRVPSLGTAGWAGVNFAIWTDANNNNQYNDNELEVFNIDKHDDVVVLEYTAFSDLARRVNTYGVEVAMLEWADTLAGHPHYNHDLSFEAMQSFHVNPAEGPVQLFANVENQENWSPQGVKRTHWDSNNGLASQSTLSQLWTNKVIWRNMPGTGQTNIEQWGHLNAADYFVPSEMNNMYQPDAKYAKFSYVQITFFRSPLNTTKPFLVRNGITPDSAQVGTTHCRLGITKKSDFNLDYKIDTADLALLKKNINRTDSTTLPYGDATNDNRIDLRDANALAAFWFEPATGTPTAAGWHNPTTGQLHLSCHQMAYVRLTGPAGTFIQTPNFGGAPIDFTEHTDTSIGFFAASGAAFDSILVATVPKHLTTTQLALTVNYLGSQNSLGFQVPLNTMVFTNLPTQSTTSHKSVIIGNQMLTYKTNSTATLSVYDLKGWLVAQQVLSQTHQRLSNLRFNYPVVAQISSPNGKMLIAKVISPNF